LFGKRKERAVPSYDKTGKIPVVRSSICTGEQVAGFKDQSSGKFQELMLIRSRSDLEKFLSQYGVEESELQREW